MRHPLSPSLSLFSSSPVSCFPFHLRLRRECTTRQNIINVSGDSIGLRIFQCNTIFVLIDAKRIGNLRKLAIAVNCNPKKKKKERKKNFKSPRAFLTSLLYCQSRRTTFVFWRIVYSHHLIKFNSSGLSNPLKKHGGCPSFSVNCRT